MNVVMLALGASPQDTALDDAAFLLDRGAHVMFVTAQARRPRGLDPRAQVLELSAAEARHPVRYLEWLLVFRLPRVTVGLLGRAPGMRERAEDLQRAYEERLAWRFHRGIFERVYRRVRPLLLWRVARRRLLPRADVAAADLVLVLDSASVPLAWHLARRRPDLPVMFSLDRSAIPPAAVPPAVPPGVPPAQPTPTGG